MATSKPSTSKDSTSKTKNSETPESSTQTPEQTPEFDFDDELLYAEDDEGKPVADAEVERVLAELPQPRPLKWRAGGATHTVEVRVSQLTHETRRAPGLVAAAIMATQRADIKGLPDTDDEAVLAAALEEDPKLKDALEKANAALADDPGYRLAQAQLVVECIVRDKKGRARVSVPQWRSLDNAQLAEAVAADPVFGPALQNAVIADVNRFFG